MKLLEKIINKLLLRESVSIEDVESAIDNHNRIIINYHSKGEDNNTGARVVEVYAYGLTKTGNPVIRCFQPYGDTTSRVPSWKFFRLDRISAWEPTKQVFTEPADEYYRGLGEFNENGDKTMSVVYKIANFDRNNVPNTNDYEQSRPKTKQDIYITDTERQMRRFQQNLDNPITLNDIKTNDAFRQINQENPSASTPTQSGPKTKQDIYKTDTERDMEKLKQQSDNPQSIDLEEPEQETNDEQEDELEKLRQALNGEPISLADLVKKMKQDPQRKREQRNMRRADRRWQKSADSRYLNRKGSLNRAFDETT